MATKETVMADLDITDEMIAERRGDYKNLPKDMPQWMSKAIIGIDSSSNVVGQIVCWTIVPIFLGMFYEVVARHFFLAPTIWAYDISRMLYGAGFMLGAGYALMRGVHIRADFLYRLWAPRKQALIDLLLYLVFYFPSMIIFLWVTIDFAQLAWMRDERGMDTAWMPPMAPIKSTIPIGIFFLIVQAVSECLKCIYTLKHNKWP